ncbi:MAG TPA: histone H1 [Phycisphaerae bacterium]|jgi:hypothetical protein|nr:histone H1 [Phycisphaerae bacterium]
MTMNPTPSPTPGSAPAPAGASGDAFEQLEKLVAAAKEDYQKAIGGNKAAGTRVRKSMQDIKSQAQAIRVRVLESRSTTP